MPRVCVVRTDKATSPERKMGDCTVRANGLVVLKHLALENQALSSGGHVRLGRNLCLELTDRGLKNNTDGG